MGTEMLPTSRNISFDVEKDGRPVDNLLYSPTSDQRFRWGKRIMTFDGRVFRYSKARTALLPGWGAANTMVVNKHITYHVITTAIVAGDLRVYVYSAATLGYASVGFATDELIGGYIVVGHNVAGGASTENRVIVGSDATTAAAGSGYIYVDGAFNIAHPITDGAEVYPNPYGYLAYGGSAGTGDYAAFMGVPPTAFTSLYNGFIQTWGPAWVIAGSGDPVPGNSADDRTVYFVGDGSVNGGTALTVETGYQMAGFLIDTTASGTGAMPLVMLQITP